MPRHNYARPGGRLVEIVVSSKHAADNMLGDPGERTVAVYLPPGYDDGDQHYPLFVDLAAFTGSGLKRLAWTGFGESVPQRLDRLVAEGKMGPVVTAFPDCFTRLGGNQYVDSAVMGRWEAFIVEDLLPALQSQFRVKAEARHRAVYGKSSGGYGALVQGLDHAEHWGAVACHSGDMGFEWLYLRDFPSTLDVLARRGGDIVRFVEEFEAGPKVKGHELHALMVLAMAATYAPEPDAPLGIRLPVDLHTCELDQARWKRWLEHDPVRMVEDERRRQNLSGLRGLFIDCGSRDQYFLHYGGRILSQRLGHYGVEHVYEEFDDNHSSIDYRLDVSLPYLYRSITS